MRRHSFVAIAIVVTGACGGGQSAAGPATGEQGAPRSGGGEAQSDQFQLQSSDDSERAHGDHPSEIRASATHAAMRLFVVDPDTGPISGMVIKLAGPDGTAFYTGETDSQGYAEVLVPAGQRYAMEYLSLGRHRAGASVDVPPGPNQDIRLTMRYRRRRSAPPPPAAANEPTAQEEPAAPPERFVLEGLLFETGSATLQAESYPRLDRVVEYMQHRVSARIRVAGHTDNAGDARRNLRLSEQRAEAVRAYLVEHGVDASRIEAVGYGDQQPVAPNDTDEGRAQNRRIEATEL